ncbi:hypothetical protein EDF67_10163 [Sphingobacterium sp. JUb78]|nr:hypothetical protein EDF67_10163 [Sphingobacterium sp. JUb78]
MLNHLGYDSSSYPITYVANAYVDRLIKRPTSFSNLHLPHLPGSVMN